jgi:glycosyltransferase involved in cell wall biosynthesis
MLYPLFMRRFDLCLPYGLLSAEYFRLYGAKRIVISPHFVDNDFFLSGAGDLAPDRDELRNKWRIPENAFCFLFCGKFQQKKHPLDILKALKQVLTLNCSDGDTAGIHPAQIYLLMVGDGGLRLECEQFARMNHLPVTFAGFLNQREIIKGYVAGDCLLLASDSGETWGLVVNEAMACDLPAIVSDACGCLPDLIVEGETGYSFPCGDIEALADRMRRMVTDKEARIRMSEGARRHISKFSVERAADTLIEAISIF